MPFLTDPHGRVVRRYSAWLMAGLLLAVMWFYPRSAFEDHVKPIGDTLDYQTIAVNFASLHIFPSSAILLPDSTYHFDTRSLGDAQRIAERKTETPTGYNFVRNPLYTFFCGLVYRGFGVHLRTLYTIQFMLLILSLACLPIAGAGVAGYRGIMAGCLAAVTIFGLNRGFATEVQTQALVLPYTIGLWWLLSRKLQRTDVWSMVCIGLYMAVGLLLKNFFIPVAVAVTGYYLFKHLHVRSLILPVVIVAGVAPWTIYANSHAPRGVAFFWLTTQGDDVLIASNNDAANDGDWHPEGVRTTSFYLSQPDSRPVAAQVFCYWLYHPLHSVSMLSEKLRRGLLTRWPPVLFIVTFLLFSELSLLPAGWRLIATYPALLVVLASVAWYVCDRDAFYSYQVQIDAWLGITDFPLLLVVILAMLACYLSAWGRLSFPASSTIIVLSFILLNVIFYGSPRIVGMIDFIWMFYTGLLICSIRAQLTE